MVAWTLVFHVIGLVFWLGGLLVETHTLAIHTEEDSPETRAALGRLESKLLRGLAHPGAAIMVITGFILVGHDPNLLQQHWLHAKLLLVVILIALDLRVTFRAFHHMPKEPSRVFREWALEALCGRSGYLGSCYPSRTALTTTDGSISSPRIFEATGNARWVAKSHSGLRSSCRIC